MVSIISVLAALQFGVDQITALSLETLGTLVPDQVSS